MSPLAIGGGVLALLLLLAGKGKAASASAAGGKAAPAVPARMAAALATGNPAANRLEAGKLRSEGYAVQAGDLEKAAALLESERAPVKPPAAPAV